jgi:acetolactate synthase-1/2/3 large subunit
MERGRGRPTFERLPYFGEMAADVLKDFKNIICVGLKPPVSFFAYPGKPSKLWPEGCKLVQVGDQRSDQITTLQTIASLVDAPATATFVDPSLPEIPKDGPFTAESIGAVVVNLLPENAIVSDETNTSGAFTYEYFDAAAPHDWMTLTGGAIGQGLPLSIGAAVACPDRKVINLQGDGSAMYTNQSLWTMARENLDVCVVIYNNSKYAILNVELGRVGVKNPGERALSMLDISNPYIDWVKMAESMGVPATRATTTEEFQEQFADAMATKGPRLIEAILYNSESPLLGLFS